MAHTCSFAPEQNPKLTDRLKVELNLFHTPVTIDHFFNDGAVVNLGDESIEALHTPGHSNDHACYFLKSSKVLFTGDLITFSDVGYLNLNKHYSESLEDFYISVKRCQNLRPVFILPGHGNMIRVNDTLWKGIYRKLSLFKNNPRLLIPHTLISPLLFYIEVKKCVGFYECEEYIVSHSYIFDNFLENCTKDLIRSEYRKLIAVLSLKNIINQEEDLLSLSTGIVHSESSWII